VFRRLPRVFKEFLTYSITARRLERFPFLTASCSSSTVMGASKTLFAACGSVLFNLFAMRLTLFVQMNVVIFPPQELRGLRSMALDAA